MLKNMQKGATMLEVIAVLGIVAMVAAGFYGTVSRVFDKFLQSKATSQLRDLQKNLKNRFAVAAKYNELSSSGIMQKLIDDRVIPYNMVRNNTVSHAYGGPVEISGGDSTYKIKLSDIKKTGCIELLMIDWTIDNTTDLVEISVGGKTFDWRGLNANSVLPIKIMDANTLCKNKPEENVIEWTFQ